MKDKDHEEKGQELLTEIGKGLGQSITGFKKAILGEDDKPNTDVKK